MADVVTIGTRGSELALRQTDYVAARLKELFPGLTVRQKLISTKGDKILDAPLAKIGGKGLFTKELEEAMLDGEIDLAVHSLKDVPTELPPGLGIAAVTRRELPWDALVSRTGQKLSELPAGAVVGTSSLRRQAQLLHCRPDLRIVNLRGNINTRLNKLADDEFDAIILAAAGLRRLGREKSVTEMLLPAVMLPAVGQGALAVESRLNDALNGKLALLNDAPTVAAVTLERAFLAFVEGGCQVPVGVYAETAGEQITAEAIIATTDGKRLLRQKIGGSAANATALGRTLAQNMLADGGREILTNFVT